jgi:hypothetical protein
LQYFPTLIARHEVNDPPKQQHTPHGALMQIYSCKEESKSKRPLARPKRRRRDNIKMDFSEVGFGRMEWIDVAQDKDQWRALVNTVMNH